MRTWWEHDRRRLDYELAELEKLGAPFKVVEEFLERGTVILRGTFKVENQEIDLEIQFPDTYPYFRFFAFARHEDLRYHQHPFEKNLCLFGSSTAEWSTQDTVAAVLRTQLPKILAANKATSIIDVLSIEESSGNPLETRQAEPVEMYYVYPTAATILVDSAWKLPPSNGSLIVGLRPTSLFPGFTGAVLEIHNRVGQTIHKAIPEISALYPHRIKGRWVHSPAPIRARTPEEYLSALRQFNSGITSPLFKKVNSIFPRGKKGPDIFIDIAATVYQDETDWRHQDGRLSWMFILRDNVVQDRIIPGKKKPQRVESPHIYFIKAERAGKVDMTIRTPELSGLESKKIALFGLGCLGSQSAIELAKAGVGELRILDHDSLSAGNAPRWAFGLSFVGWPKTQIITEHIKNNYPYTHVIPHICRLGSILDPRAIPPDAAVKSESQVLTEMLDGVDVIYDATAEVGIQHLLSDLAAEKGIPYIAIETTHGTRGGIITRCIPGRTAGCWGCLQHHLTEETIIPPNRDESASAQVTPAGCGSPTFTGNNFDALEIALAGVRMAISTLMEQIPGGYPRTPWDVAVINLRDGDGKLIPPQWSTYPLTRHINCRNHAS